jgi:hypothetical protein
MAGIVKKSSPIRFKPVSPTNKSNNESNSISPSRIIPINQIKIVHSP